MVPKTLTTDNLDCAAAYEAGFESGLNHVTSDGRDHSLSDEMNDDFGQGFRDGQCYFEELKNIRENAKSDNDIFLTILNALEVNSIPSGLANKLISTFYEVSAEREARAQYEEVLDPNSEIEWAIDPRFPKWRFG